MTEQDKIEGKAASPLPSFRLETLKKRAEFKKANGARFTTPFFTLQRRPDGPEPVARMRFGFTVTRKIGNAVERNRIRRRLREALRLAAKPEQPMEIVIFARREVLDAEFTALVAEITRGLANLARKGAPAGPRGSKMTDRQGQTEAVLGKPPPLA